MKKRTLITIIIALVIILSFAMFYPYKYMQTDESETQDEQENKTFILSPGQSTEINGVAFTLVKIAGDSRCPLDVTCIWAGAVTA